jgi:secreted trypsin-like serine protease
VLRSLLVAALLLIALAPAALAAPQAKTSIVGGQTADIADWPSIAFLLAAWDSDGDGELDAQSQCTGTVIAPQWVISAAHCAFRPGGAVDAMVTVTGVGDLNDPSGEPIVADQLVVHPDWDPETLTGDALLIHLRTPSSRPAHPVARPGGDYVTVPNRPNAAGWGTTDEASTIGTDVLKEAYLALQGDDVCAHFARDFDAATQTCAGTANTAGACKGDSGGPLLVFDAATGAPVLWGLTSYGPQLGLGMKVCELKAPAIFSWTPAFSSWIADTLNPRPSTPGPADPQAPNNPVIRPPRDATAPVIAGARLSAARLRAGRRAKLSFRLSEPAAVTLTVMRKKGRRYRALAPTMPLGASAGTVSRRFDGRLGGKALKPGRYKLAIAAVDAAGNSARPVAVPFRMVR